MKCILNVVILFKIFIPSNDVKHKFEFNRKPNNQRLFSPENCTL